MVIRTSPVVKKSLGRSRQHRPVDSIATTSVRLNEAWVPLTCVYNMKLGLGGGGLVDGPSRVIGLTEVGESSDPEGQPWSRGSEIFRGRRFDLGREPIVIVGVRFNLCAYARGLCGGLTTTVWNSARFAMGGSAQPRPPVGLGLNLNVFLNRPFVVILY